MLHEDELVPFAFLGGDYRGANDDVELFTGPHPRRTDLTGVFIRNRNSTRGVVASIRVNASSTLKVRSSMDNSYRQRWPLQFEVRVAPGADEVIGVDEYPVWDHIDIAEPVPSSGLQVTLIKQDFKIQGAYYKNVPFPSLNEDPLVFLYHYEVPIINSSDYRYLPVSMNLHGTRTIRISNYQIISQGAHEYFSDLPVIAGLQNYHQPQKTTFTLKALDADFSS